MLKAQPETRNHVLVCLKTIFCPCNFPILPKWSNSSSDFEDFSQVARQKTDTSTVHQLPNIIITLKWFSFRASQGEPSYCGAWVTACAAKVSILLVRALADWWEKSWCDVIIWYSKMRMLFSERFTLPPMAVFESPIGVTFQIQPFSTSMFMGERVPPHSFCERFFPEIWEQTQRWTRWIKHERHVAAKFFFGDLLDEKKCSVLFRLLPGVQKISEKTAHLSTQNRKTHVFFGRDNFKSNWTQGLISYFCCFEMVTFMVRFLTPEKRRASKTPKAAESLRTFKNPNTRLQICPLYIFGNYPPQMVQKRI